MLPELLTAPEPAGWLFPVIDLRLSNYDGIIITMLLKKILFWGYYYDDKINALMSPFFSVFRYRFPEQGILLNQHGDDVYPLA